MNAEEISELLFELDRIDESDLGDPVGTYWPDVAAVVDAIAARAVTAALDAAAVEIGRLAAAAGDHIHGDDDAETVMAYKTNLHAARIVRAHAT